MKTIVFFCQYDKLCLWTFKEIARYPVFWGEIMIIGARLRELREAKGLSQGDIERQSGLLRCYISRIEHGHTVPSLETLERFAAALDIPLYRLFCAGEDAPATPHLT